MIWRCKILAKAFLCLILGSFTRLNHLHGVKDTLQDSLAFASSCMVLRGRIGSKVIKCIWDLWVASLWIFPLIHQKLPCLVHVFLYKELLKCTVIFQVLSFKVFIPLLLYVHQKGLGNFSPCVKAIFGSCKTECWFNQPW